MNNSLTNNLPVMMYIHGFCSGANGSKCGQLQKYFEGRYRVIAPEVDAHPEKSLAIINDIIAQENPRIVIGTSLGGWMTLMCDSNDASLVVVNPSLCPQETLSQWKNEGLEYFCQRKDGIQIYKLTDEVFEKYDRYDVVQALTDKRDRLYALCSSQDELLGTSHIELLRQLLLNDHLTITDDFGHRCSGQGMHHLFKILEVI